MTDDADAPERVRRANRWRLTATRTLRGFGAGALSVVLAIDLAASGFGPALVGVVLGVALGAAAGWAILIPGRSANRAGRVWFAFGALAVAGSGFLLWLNLTSPWTLLPALLLGGIVAGGSDVSLLAALEQGALSRNSPGAGRTPAFAIYNLVGYAGTAAGALVAGPLRSATVPLLPSSGSATDPMYLLYALIGVALVPLYLSLARTARLTEAPIERPLSPGPRSVVLRLSALFSVDAVGGGMIANALVAYFLVLKFHASADTVGVILALASLAAGASLAMAVPLARRFGLVNTMVFTHLPSSALLIAFAFTPSLPLAGFVWVARATLSQMDVPTRQSYTQAIVPPEEGASAAGYTTAARSAQAFGSPVSGSLFAIGTSWLGSPFAIAGGVKIGYDLLLYRSFRRVRPPEELPATALASPSATANGRRGPPL